MSTITAMGIIDEIVEAQIRQAIARGDFDDLPGVGKPLALEDDALVPEELRMAYRILKNAGYVPEEVRLRRDIGDLEQLVARLDGEEYAGAVKRLNLLRARLSAQRGAGGSLQIEEQYRNKVLGQLQAKGPSEKQDPRE